MTSQSVKPSAFQPYYNILKYAEETIKTANNNELRAMHGLTMEDHNDCIANIIRSEYFKRREARAASRKHS